MLLVLQQELMLQLHPLPMQLQQWLLRFLLHQLHPDLLLQLQADLADVTVLRPPVREATARGAALLAGCTLGLWSPDRLPEPQQQPDSFSPSLPDDRRRALQSGWQRAVAATRSFTGGSLS